MSQQGETDHRQEDEWWRQLYGEAVPAVPGPRDPDGSDTVDDRYASALDALGGAEPDVQPDVPSEALSAPASDAPPAVPPGVPSAVPSEPPRARVPELRPWEYQGAPAAPTTSGDGRITLPQAPPPALPPGWAPADPGPGAAPRAAPAAEPEIGPEIEVGYVGDGPPTYEAEPTAWPVADPANLDDLVPDTVLDGARYGVLTVRIASVRGDSARYRGEPRRDSLLAARFGTGDDALLLLAVASGPRAAEAAHRAAQDACRWIAGAVGRSHARLAEDIRAARRGSLKSGLHRLTDRCYGRLRARGEDLGLDPAEYSVALRCLLLPADPECRTRLFFGAGDGGLFRIRDGEWQDLDARRPDETAADPEPQDSIPGAEPAIRFRFRASVAQPGDTLLLCSGGLAEPLRGEPGLAAHLTRRWGSGEAPGLAAFLGDAQTRVKGYADDRTAVAVWER
ncbi:protein phosphatase 2C domain-containing protein [Actinacidiphila soli]|uniref:protein phosphatase 2C domain-containing protein n=1 Tax=Actinacidiphila soli TaxID=2487275 RepID=UPI000FCB1566|nr:protein phosphatase 2C domain-containing protein [Actinacidiphila soli]